MRRIDLISQPQAGPGRARRLRAFFASCAFHGLALGLLLWLTFLYREQTPPVNGGSAQSAPTLTLSTLSIISPAPVPRPKPTPPVVSPAPSATVTSATPPREPETKPQPPEATVPVLAVHPTQPEPAKPITITASVQPAPAHPAPVVTATVHASPKPAAFASSYAPGLNTLPHPPYPPEAHDRGETGTVTMNVRFDTQGGVAEVDVAQSSGVPVLDASTRSFIRAHWHSAEYAGQTMSVPVQYTLENL